ncbi:MAG: FG-GAP repeat protein, partial [Chloroflexi bacterium]|nr:FG-GAP repeat protein [Chloroflexota bacterium]
MGFLVLAALAMPGSTDAASLNEFKKLTASDAQAADWFGWSVAGSGDAAVVGALG